MKEEKGRYNEERKEGSKVAHSVAVLSKSAAA